MIMFMSRGYAKGFVKILMSLISILLAMFFVTWATPHISNLLEKNTGLYTAIESRCEKSIEKKLEGTAKEQVQEKLEGMAKEQQVQETLVQGLPKDIQNWIQTEATKNIGDVVENTGISSVIAAQVACYITNGVASLIAMIIAAIIVHFLTDIFELASKIPLVSSVNKFLGMLVGGCQGLLLIWVAFFVVTLCYQSEYGQQIQRLIYQNTILTYLYNNNLLVTLSILFLK